MHKNVHMYTNMIVAHKYVHMHTNMIVAHTKSRIATTHRVFVVGAKSISCSGWSRLAKYSDNANPNGLSIITN